jgi:hypothetical protein
MNVSFSFITMNRVDDRIQFIVPRVMKDEAMRLGFA